MSLQGVDYEARCMKLEQDIERLRAMLDTATLAAFRPARVLGGEEMLERMIRQGADPLGTERRKLKAEIDRSHKAILALTAEVERLRAEIETHLSDKVKLRAEIERLRAERDDG